MLSRRVAALIGVLAQSVGLTATIYLVLPLPEQHMCPGSQDFLCGITPALNCYLQHQPTPYPSRCGVGERPFPPKRRRRVLLLSKQRSVLPAGPGPPGRLEDHLPGPPPSTSVAGAPTGGAQAAVAEQTWPQWNQRRQLRRRAVWSECRRRPRTTSHSFGPPDQLTLSSLGDMGRRRHHLCSR